MKWQILRLKGSMQVSHFTLEVDSEFKSPGDIEKFIEWAEKLRIFHPPNKTARKSE